MSPQKFRKRPVVIEAMQWPGDGAYEDAKVLRQWVRDGGGKAWVTFQGGLVIGTLEGDHIAMPGDWIIRGIEGEHYPCKPSVFAATYEAVES